MNHLRRLERSMLAGAVVAIVVAVVSRSNHKALAAQAAASHESVARFLLTGIIGVTLAVGLGVFLAATIVAQLRRRRFPYGGEW